jgi:hypothetical protein
MSAIGPRRTLLSGSLGRDVQNWRGAVIANGGAVTPARLASVSTLISSLKASGAWANADDYWLLVADNATQALTSLKQRRLATAVNSPTFTANAGYAFDGVTNYIDTGFISSTMGVAMTGSNMRLGVYERTNVGINNYALGASQGSNKAVGVRPRLSTTANVILNSNVVTLNTVADSRGLTAASRNDATTTPPLSLYKNGVLQQTVAATSGANVLVGVSLWLGGLDNSGTLNLPRAATIGWVSIGAALTAGQELAEYNAVQAYMMTWGAGV